MRSCGRERNAADEVTRFPAITVDSHAATGRGSELRSNGRYSKSYLQHIDWPDLQARETRCAMAEKDENESSSEEAETVPVPPEPEKQLTISVKKATLKKVGLAAGGAVILALGFVAFQLFGQSQVFSEAAEACLASDRNGVTVDDGGGAMYLNGEGEESAGVDVLTQICILNELNVPDSVYDRIASTTSLMGVQDATWDNYEASWTYHPNNGLDISIERG